MNKRLIELALEALLAQRASLDEEIAKIRAALEGPGRHQLVKSGPPSPAVGRRRPKTAAERKALSAKMKAYWAARKVKAAREGPRKESRGKQRKG